MSLVTHTDNRIMSNKPSVLDRLLETHPWDDRWACSSPAAAASLGRSCRWRASRAPWTATWWMAPWTATWWRAPSPAPAAVPPTSRSPPYGRENALMSSNCQLSPSSAAASGGCSECWRWQRSAPPHPDHQTSSPAGRHSGCTSQTAPASITSLSVLLANKRYNIFSLLTAYQWPHTRDDEVAAAKPRGLATWV